MKTMLDLIQKRRSCRQFLPRKVEPEKTDHLIKAALWSPTSKNNRPWEFVVVENPTTIEALSKSKPHGAAFLAKAPLAIVILADPSKSDVWVEDCSIAAILIQMVAEDIGLGSTWIQIRKREHNDTTGADSYVRDAIQAPGHLDVASVIAIGYKENERELYSEETLMHHKIHRESFKS